MWSNTWNNVWFQVDNLCKEDGIINTLIDKLRNSTRYRESHRLLRTRLPLHTSLSSNTIVSSLAANRPIFCDRTYFYTSLCTTNILSMLSYVTRYCLDKFFRSVMLVVAYLLNHTSCLYLVTVALRVTSRVPPLPCTVIFFQPWWYFQLGLNCITVPLWNSCLTI